MHSQRKQSFIFVASDFIWGNKKHISSVLQKQNLTTQSSSSHASCVIITALDIQQTDAALASLLQTNVFILLQVAAGVNCVCKKY